MLINDRFASAVGFTLTSDSAHRCFGDLEGHFGFGEVTFVDAVDDNERGGVVPLLMRMIGDDSGAAITAGLSEIRYGFLADDGGVPTFVATEPDESPMSRLATCFLNDEGLLTAQDHHFAACHSDSAPYLDLDIDAIDEEYAPESHALSIQYVPLNPGEHDFLGSDTGVSYTEDKARFGLLQLIGLFEASTLIVTLESDIDYADAVEDVDFTDFLCGPIAELTGIIVGATKLRNQTTNLEFWFLQVEFACGRVLNFCAEHPFLAGEFEHFSPYPVGSVIHGTVLFTGHFSPVVRSKLTGSSSVARRVIMDPYVLPTRAQIQGGLPSANSMSVSERRAGTAWDFSYGYSMSDVAGCLGFDFTSNSGLFWQFQRPPASAMSMSTNRLSSFLAADSPAGTFEDNPAATWTLAQPMTISSRHVLCTLGLSLPALSWGAALIFDPARTGVNFYAAVDCNFYTDIDEMPASLAGLVGADRCCADSEYGEVFLGAAVVKFPQLHRNPFTHTAFLSVQVTLDDERAIALLPCPEWLAEQADQHGDGSVEVARALQKLSGKYVAGLFDNCGLGISDEAIMTDEYEDVLRVFDREMRVRTPELAPKQVAQRRTRALSRCYRNPEIDHNAVAVRYLTERTSCSTVELMSKLRTGPNGLEQRVQDIYGAYGINIYRRGDDEWAVERREEGTEWIPLSEDQIGAGLLGCRVAQAWQRDGGLWDEVESVKSALWEAASIEAVEQVSEAFGVPGSPGPDDTSIQDYLTDEDCFDNHVGVLERAIVEKKKVSMLYGNREDEPTARVIHPAKTVVLNRPYVLAWDELREDWRTFRVDRIKTCSLTDEEFEPRFVSLPEDIDPDELEGMYGRFGDDVDNATIRVAWSLRFAE
ncbi:helix-turn-helix transcriptional regulator [Corynebacterium sp. H113]|uniref:helix-turn-helix transcriptional regulator n=1 Tax=Corynebacterium sp. H113 TaxID=3133419 RepID=UPI0030AF94A2